MFSTINSKLKSIERRIRSHMPLSRKKFSREIENLKREFEFIKNSLGDIVIIANTDKIFSLKVLYGFMGRGGYPYKDDIKFYLPLCLTDLIQGLIAKTADFYEIRNLKKVNKFLKDGANILDIGANIGNHSIYWAMVRKAQKIHAFEPTTDVFEILCKNIELNSLQDIIKPHNFALGLQEGKVSIKVRPALNLGGTQLKYDESGELIVKSLDGIQAEFEGKIDFIKIDVEGFEAQVLLGAKEFLAQHKPVIMIEIHPPKFKEVSEILDSLNYKLTEKLGSADFIYLPKN